MAAGQTGSTRTGTPSRIGLVVFGRFEIAIGVKKKGEATIYDVAKAAGVSTATVSRLLNNVGTIRDETRHRVLKAIEELEYTPKFRAGQDLHDPIPHTASRPEIVFLKVGELEALDRSPITRTFLEELRRKTDSLNLPFRVVDAEESALSAPVRDVIGEDVKGVFLRSSNIRLITPACAEWLKGIPALQVLGENRGGRLWMDHVTPDNLQAGVIAADYLIRRNCERVVFASVMNLRRINFERMSSFVSVAAEAGKDVYMYLLSDPEYLEQIRVSTSGFPSNCRVFSDRQELLATLVEEQKGQEFGFFVPADIRLAIFLSELKALGLDVEHQVHSIGCNAELRWFDEVEATPATINLQIEHLADLALRRLLHRIQYPSDPWVRLSVMPELIPPQEVVRLRESSRAEMPVSAPIQVF